MADQAVPAKPAQPTAASPIFLDMAGGAGASRRADCLLDRAPGPCPAPEGAEPQFADGRGQLLVTALASSGEVSERLRVSACEVGRRVMGGGPKGSGSTTSSPWPGHSRSHETYGRCSTLGGTTWAAVRT